MKAQERFHVLSLSRPRLSYTAGRQELTCEKVAGLEQLKSFPNPVVDCCIVFRQFTRDLFIRHHSASSLRIVTVSFLPKSRELYRTPGPPAFLRTAFTGSDCLQKRQWFLQPVRASYLCAVRHTVHSWCFSTTGSRVANPGPAVCVPFQSVRYSQSPYPRAGLLDWHIVSSNHIGQSQNLRRKLLVDRSCELRLAVLGTDPKSPSFHLAIGHLLGTHFRRRLHLLA